MRSDEVIAYRGRWRAVEAVLQLSLLPHMDRHDAARE
jgi:hypothetical protein